jgi:1-acyl-sn-glycerol-3-phosphate acyltransferase
MGPKEGRMHTNPPDDAARFLCHNRAMIQMRNLNPSLGSSLTATLRALAFFGLIAALVPLHLINSVTRPKEPFRISLLFYRNVLRVMGFHIRVRGRQAMNAPVLFVVNHTSYLDVPVLGSLIPAAFIAKADVAKWPLIGPLAKMQRTVFIERRSTDVQAQRKYLRGQLGKGQSLVLFPEGTSSDGLHVLPFKSSLFSIVEGEDNANVTIQPVTIACTALGGLPMTRAFRAFYTWYGDMTFVAHLWTVFKLGHFTVDVIFHPPVAPADFPNRKALSAYCRQQVAEGMAQCLTGRDGTNTRASKLELPLAAKRLHHTN